MEDETIIKCNPQNNHDFNDVDITPERDTTADTKPDWSPRKIKLYCRKCGEVRTL